ncbi:hypothetical protein HDU76_005981 [Blyttiomyces sp. JEL0837]|nr:hypothetical protein HDU76_005981 [Blyttiomyces sp. JEL0837]
MRAAKIFIESLKKENILHTDSTTNTADNKIVKVRVDLYGSLAMTGEGHGTPGAVLMGLEGETPELVDAKSIPSRVEGIKTTKVLKLGGHQTIEFNYARDLVFHYRQSLPQHPNGMRISCYDEHGDMIATNEFFSVGGGFVVNEDLKINPAFNIATTSTIPEPAKNNNNSNQQTQQPAINPAVFPTTTIPAPSQLDLSEHLLQVPFPFHNAESLLKMCESSNQTIAQLVLQNEMKWRKPEDVVARVLQIWNVMDQSIRNGILSNEEWLPGPLKVKRRAPMMYRKLMGGFAEYAGLNATPSISIQKSTTESVTEALLSHLPATRGPRVMSGLDKPNGHSNGKVSKRSLPALDWISLYALAVNEENAAGGRVVTAPTNGAAGTIPAVLKYYLDFVSPSNQPYYSHQTPPHTRDQEIVEFLLTAAAIGMLYKNNASISAAEMGCQGEVGVACSMASGAFVAVMGGSISQVENAAEIGMEHNLGLTCDPPLGLVVIPCIERNALAATKAITAGQLAMHGDGFHRVTLDQVIETMRLTGLDMQTKYKETSEGGLAVAVNVPVC